MVGFMDLIGVWYSKAIVFVKHYRLNVYLFSILRPILPGKCFGQRDWKVIEC
jgi:hypothetical protein